MTSAITSARQARAEHTRTTLLAAAEQLIAEHGVAAVTHRQITKAAGQANNAAVVYHFGTKLDLVRSIGERHFEPIEALRLQSFATSGDPESLRGWVSYLVKPFTDHLAELGSPSWYARYAAQVLSDPTYQHDTTKRQMSSPTMRRIVDGIAASAPHLPEGTRHARTVMMRTMLMHTCAEFERGFADQEVAHPDWQAVCRGMIDAIVGLWEAPVTSE
ncbi:TetR/AcrR family transcriptional regulator [Mycolicibacterium moriokaense]|nr:TetR/AcrR family transcriptional regulator [Mycolicibacterium moriokaense]